jgi:3-methyladenine DNA glycosylase AlkD
MNTIQKELQKYASEERRKVNLRFFKTGKGQYGEGDAFIGVTVPDTRLVAKKFSDISFEEIQSLLDSPIHEERLVGLLVLVEQYQKRDVRKKKDVFEFYLQNTPRVNNWDLVDLSADKIVGAHLEKEKERKLLDTLSKSSHLWEKRIAIVSTLHFIRKGEFADTFRITDNLMGDPHDMLHKACGWMLREVGKKDEQALKKFLQKRYKRMPRTMLRYSIERFFPAERKKYLEGKI